MKVIIAHDLHHALAAMQAAHDLALPVIIHSAPDAIYHTGAGYIFQMFKKAQEAFPDVDATFILDCADAGAETIAAMQTGHKTLRSRAPAPARGKLADIARQYGARMIDGLYEPLDLARVRDTKGACEKWLRSKA